MPTTTDPRDYLNKFVSLPGRDAAIRRAMYEDRSWFPDPGPSDPSLWVEIVRSRATWARTQAAAAVDSLEGLLALSAAKIGVSEWVGILSNPLCTEAGAEGIYERAMAFGRGRPKRTTERLAEAVATASRRTATAWAHLATEPWFVTSAAGGRVLTALDWGTLEPAVLDALVQIPLGNATLVHAKLGQLLAQRRAAPETVIALARQHRDSIVHLSDICEPFANWALALGDWELFQRVLHGVACPRVAAAIVVEGRRRHEPWAKTAERLCVDAMASKSALASRSLWVQVFADAGGSEYRFGRQLAEALLAAPDVTPDTQGFVRLSAEAAAAVWERCSPQVLASVVGDLDDPGLEIAAFRRLLSDRNGTLQPGWLSTKDSAFFEEAIDGLDEDAQVRALGRLSAYLDHEVWAERRKDGAGLSDVLSVRLARALGARELARHVALLHHDGIEEAVRILLDGAGTTRGHVDESAQRQLALALVDTWSSELSPAHAGALLALLPAEQAVSSLLHRPYLPGTLAAAVEASRQGSSRGMDARDIGDNLRWGRGGGRPEFYEEALALVEKPGRFNPDTMAAIDRVFARAFGEDAERWELAIGLLGTWEGTVLDLVEAVGGLVFRAG